jgi:23S rRNA-/tRNA-specific pseudouridylate synthase
LEIPEIIFSNNHLLVVNKPAGWKSQPGDGGGGGSNHDGSYGDPKCLLTYLKSQSLGGGSQKDFLTPTHRLDQPCTGALIFAKNGKAASRVQVAWSKRKVQKCYWVVVEGGTSAAAGANGGGRPGGGNAQLDGLELLRSRSVRLSGNADRGRKTEIQRLSAVLKSCDGGKGKNAGGRGGCSNHNAGGSVTVTPLPHPLASDKEDGVNGRVCHVEWEHALSLRPTAPTLGMRYLLSVTTDTYAKHQVRALLTAMGGAPIAGDLRYGNHVGTRRRNCRLTYVRMIRYYF